MLERNEISVHDFLNRVLWNDKNLEKFFCDFDSVDVSSKDELLIDEENGDSSDDDQVDIDKENMRPLDIVAALREELDEPIDSTKCNFCMMEKKNIAANCGHLSCKTCWDKWIVEQTKIVENSDEPLRKKRKMLREPKCMSCLKPVKNVFTIYM